MSYWNRPSPEQTQGCRTSVAVPCQECAHSSDQLQTLTEKEFQENKLRTITVPPSTGTARLHEMFASFVFFRTYPFIRSNPFKILVWCRVFHFRVVVRTKVRVACIVQISMNLELSVTFSSRKVHILNCALTGGDDISCFSTEFLRYMWESCPPSLVTIFDIRIYLSNVCLLLYRCSIYRNFSIYGNTFPFVVGKISELFSTSEILCPISCASAMTLF